MSKYFFLLLLSLVSRSCVFADKTSPGLHQDKPESSSSEDFEQPAPINKKPPALKAVANDDNTKTDGGYKVDKTDGGCSKQKEELVSADLPKMKSVRFEWCPSKKVAAAYQMQNPADQHEIVFTKGVKAGGTYPVIVGFHGQPKRGRSPGDYMFLQPVKDLVNQMVSSGEIKPVILVLPVFRFTGGNWPYFNPKKFGQKVKEILEQNKIKVKNWYAFGHSGAAGCGGGGLNEIHVLKPAAVGFFDTCLGAGWSKEIKTLQKKKIKTLTIHSVETAGFKPKQKPEYQHYFKFKRAYEPAGLFAVPCPQVIPGKKLRPQKGKCSATKDGIITGFILDTGEGKEAHRAILEPAIRYFLKEFAGL